MFVSQINVESLGNSSYLVGSTEAGVCAVVDPVRDVDLYIEEAASRGLRIAYSLETHVHNDFISGSRELAARTGAMVCAPAAGGLIFEHRSLRPGDSIDVGEVRLDVIATPGHTPEHVSYLATDTGDSSVPKALFSGGALLVGGVPQRPPGQGCRAISRPVVPPHHNPGAQATERRRGSLPHPRRGLFLSG